MNVLTVRRYLIRLSVFSFLPSWIWAFRVRSHSHSQWCPPSKDHFFALNGQNNLWGCFHKRKRMFCRIKASGDWCTTHVWAEEWMKPKTFFSRTTWSMGSSVQGVFRSCGVSELTCIWTAICHCVTCMVGLAWLPVMCEKCGFLLTEERTKQERFFSHTAESMGSSVQEVSRSCGVSQFQFFFLPSTIAWPVPPTLHVFFLKVKVVLVWKEHLKSQTFFWKQSKILHIALKGAPLINHHHIKINAVLSNKNRGLTCLEVLLLLWILGCSYLHGMTDYFPIS